MANIKNIKSVLVIGGGPIKIGHACEFDYSGTQACLALKQEGIFTILLNSNPATFMTSPEVADVTYIDSININTLLKIIEKHRPDAILPFAGGQVALNATLELSNAIDSFNEEFEVLGTPISCINNSEDRCLFNKILIDNDIDCLKSFSVNAESISEISAEGGSYPVILRTSYTLGGSHSRIAKSYDEFIEECKNIWSTDKNIEIFVEEYVDGWHEYELEVIKDKNNNFLVICCIENIDPMGIHTGDSMTISPPVTVTKEDYDKMCTMSYKAAKGIGITAGGFNVQFAKCPETNRIVMIEINPRLSRSSAFASKATGIPIATIATKLSLGYSIDDIKNQFHLKMYEFIENKPNYVVVKIPVFQFPKLNCSNTSLKSYMQSIGESMGIGSCFKEALIKAIQGAESEAKGLTDDSISKISNDSLKEMLISKHYRRLFAIAECLRRGISVLEISTLTKIDKYFIQEINDIIKCEEEITHDKSLKKLSYFKRLGLSDEYISKLAGIETQELVSERISHNINPDYKAVDNFNKNPKYLYSTYSANSINNGTSDKKVIIIGSGPNKIGQGLEFDYCCVHASIATSKSGFESVMINCNPATVSTDYSISDRLYFDPITSEHVLNLINKEKPLGVFLQFGGQPPLCLAKTLHDYGVKILGTSFESIDLAEDRMRFRDFLKKHSIPQPRNEIVSNLLEASSAIDLVGGYPVILRPSYVIGGSKLAKINDKQELISYFSNNATSNILVEKFIENAIEIDVDAICDGENCVICGIMQQLDPSGIHSGDSSCITPPYDLDSSIIAIISDYTKEIALNLKIIGLLNVQFLVKDNHVLVIEANPRASRTIPFIAKAFGFNLIEKTVKICLENKKLDTQQFDFQKKFFALKVPVFSEIPFSNLLKKEEMCSTGEEMFFGITSEEVLDRNTARAVYAINDILS